MIILSGNFQWIKELNCVAPGVPKFLVGTMADRMAEEDGDIPSKRLVKYAQCSLSAHFSL